MSHYPEDPGRPARQVASRQTETMFGQSGAFAQTRPYSDPHQQAIASLLSFHSTTRVVEGVVMDSTMLAHCYKVFVEKGRAPILASFGAQTSLGIAGARQINTLLPGTRVALLLHPGSSFGVIISAMPMRATSAKRSLADLLTGSGRPRVDEMHKRPLKMIDNGGVVNWISGRPFDSIDGGEAGWITSTGVRISIDDFMVQIGANEFCGLWAFYHDALARLAGYNLQVWSAGSERDSLDDEGEFVDIQRYSPFLWEAKGVFEPTTEALAELTKETYQLSQPWYSRWEPKSDRQHAFSRVTHYQGYLGQGGRQILIAPPQSPPEVWQYAPGKTGAATSAYTSGTQSGGSKPTDPSFELKPPIGLHVDNVGMDGRRFIGTAKGIIVAKRILLPDATQIARQESGHGDNATNYKASGQFGDGPEHKITGDIATNGSPATVQRAAAVLDLHAYLFNYSGLHPFHYHDKDFKTWEEQELTHSQVNQTVPTFSSLKSSMYMDPPSPKRVKIDHRYGEQDYYPTEAFWAILDDGGIVFGDGAGAEMRMVGGSIFFSAPGDIWTKAGRNLHNWAGRDWMTRAKGSAEISTSEKSIRLKSERDIMISAGNSKIGGVLIESRAESPIYDFTKIGDDVQFGGVVIRAPKSEVVALSKQIYLRSGGTKEIEEGDITIDCARGKKNLVVNCDNHISYLEGGAYHFFGTEGEIVTSNEFTQQFTGLCSMTGINGVAAVVGDIINEGYVLVASGHIATEYAKQFSYFVAPLEGKGLAQVKDFLGEIRGAIENEYPAFGKTFYDYNPKQLWYDEKRPGNTDIIDKIEFSFRTMEQYKSQDFLLFEDRWQQMARLAGQSGEPWEEKFVKTQVDPETYPFPGKEKYKEPVYIEQDLELYKFEGGGFRSLQRAVSHDPVQTEPKYETPAYAAPKRKTLNASYLIVG